MTVLSRQIRTELEQHMSCNLMQYKEFIDNEMLLILGQMDKATLIFDHLYLVSHLATFSHPELLGNTLACSHICLCSCKHCCCHWHKQTGIRATQTLLNLIDRVHFRVSHWLRWDLFVSMRFGLLKPWYLADTASREVPWKSNIWTAHCYKCHNCVICSVYNIFPHLFAGIWMECLQSGGASGHWVNGAFC